MAATYGFFTDDMSSFATACAEATGTGACPQDEPTFSDYADGSAIGLTCATSADGQAATQATAAADNNVIVWCNDASLQCATLDL